MSPKQICYPDLYYILWINSGYGLFFCLSQIDNSKIKFSLGLFPVVKSSAIIYSFFCSSILILSAGNILLCPRWWFILLSALNKWFRNLILTLVISSSQRYNICLFIFHSSILILAKIHMLLCPRCHVAYSPLCTNSSIVKLK